MIVADYQRQYNVNLYLNGLDISEEYFFILYAGLIPTDSAFLHKMSDKYKDVIKATQKPQHTKEITNPREFMQALNSRRR